MDTRIPKFVCRNGEIIPSEEARVSIFNPAVFSAFGVYETLLVWEGVIFRPEEHLNRLWKSAMAIGLPLPWDTAEIAVWLNRVREANEFQQGRLKVILIGPPPGEESPLCFAWTWPAMEIPPRAYEKGVSTITFKATRFMPQAKTMNTLPNLMAKNAARASNAHEALLVNFRDEITEGATSNFFAVSGGKILHAPEMEILTGVTMSLVLEIAEKIGITTEERPLPVDEIESWDEAFITSTSRKVLPVTSIDGKQVGEGVVGEITRALMEEFDREFEEYIRSHKEKDESGS
jgi:branched-chain amino acid aminotransferase